MQKNKPPSTADTTRFTVYSERLSHQISSCLACIACGVPRRTMPSPGVCCATPTTRTHSVFTPSCTMASGRRQVRGMFQLRDNGSVSCASLQIRSLLTNTSPAITTDSKVKPTGPGQGRCQSMRYQTDPL
ncbi:hypothetical protein D3C71_1447930 [compost metagenome]